MDSSIWRCDRVFRNAIGLRCLHCSDVIEPRHCHTITYCDANESCVVEKTQIESGEILYNIGCKSSKFCNQPGPASPTHKNNLHHVKSAERHSRILCTECCNDRDLCNSAGCGSRGYPADIGPTCFNCLQIRVPTKCDTVTTCNSDQHCFIEEQREFGDVFYRTRCLPTHECKLQSISEVIIGKRDVSRINRRSVTCSGCCHDDLCNSHCPVSNDPITSSAPITSLQTSTIISTTTTTISTTTTVTTTTATTTPKTTSTTNTPTTETTTKQASSQGTDFIIMFMLNANVGYSQQQEILISSLEPTKVEVFTAFDGSGQNRSITNVATRLNFTKSAVTGANVIENKGIYIKSKSRISVNVLNAYMDGCCSDDGYTAIPIDFLGSEYVAVSVKQDTTYVQYKNQIGVVAVYDNTSIAFNLKVSAPVTYKEQTYNNGDKLQITLNRLQSFVLSYKQTNEYETNMKVTGNKPFAMISGNQCGSIKGRGCSYMVESAPPTVLYGQYYIVPKLSGLFYNTGYLKFTPLNSTDLAFEDATKTSVTLLSNSSSFESVDLGKPTVIPGKTPFLLTFYGQMNVAHAYLMINLPPLCRYSNNYTITTPSTRNYDNYISVVIETQYKSQLLLDNNVLNNRTSATFALFGNSWSSLTLPIADGTHILRHPDITVRFGIIQYGYNFGHSYGFPVHNDFLGPSKYCKQISP